MWWYVMFEGGRKRTYEYMETLSDIVHVLFSRKTPICTNENSTIYIPDTFLRLEILFQLTIFYHFYFIENWTEKKIEWISRNYYCLYNSMKIIINLEEAFSAFIPKRLEILSFHQSSLPLNGKIGNRSSMRYLSGPISMLPGSYRSTTSSSSSSLTSSSSSSTRNAWAMMNSQFSSFQFRLVFVNVSKNEQNHFSKASDLQRRSWVNLKK